MLNLFRFLINSNIYISVAAVFLTIETQVQLGMKPQWQPYLLIVFFATFFEYNLHRLITVVTNKDALKVDKHQWVRKHLKQFYLIVIISAIGFLLSLFLAKKEVLIALAPVAVLTIFYSLPVFRNKTNIFRLREIPFLKIFLIAFVWSVATIFLPIIQSGNLYNKVHVMIMLIERFVFVFAITIPFDIRDMKQDAQSGLKTIPLLIGEKRALFIANIGIMLFLAISAIHYQIMNLPYILIAFIVSAITTFVFINNKKLRKMTYYHYGLLDGAMLFQGLIVCIFYFLICK